MSWHGFSPRRPPAWLLLVLLALACALVRADEITDARKELERLQAKYGEKHPAVVDQQLRMSELLRLARERADEAAVLRVARADLAVRQKRYGENNPRLNEQEARVKKMEEKLAENPAMAPELLAAWGELTVVYMRYGDRNSR